ncbi:MAG: hypothetical protein WD156_05540 [Acidimicrobiia bacterium]
MGLPLDVDAPVTAEVFTLVRDGARILLTGPCGADSWLIETDRSAHPLDVVRRIVTDVLGAPVLVHSTSWRFERQSVYLTFVVVVATTGTMDFVQVERVELARSAATAAPSVVAGGQVLEHGIRHLAWLALEDAVVRDTLDAGWHAILNVYVPEPFRQLE